MMMTSAQEISAFLTRIVETSKVSVLTVQKKIAFDILSGVVLMTPVDTGRARGGWQLSIGEPAPLQELPTDPSGNVAVQNGLFGLNSLNQPGIVFISNNVRYILKLEFGSSKQAPNGMVEATLARIATSLNPSS